MRVSHPDFFQIPRHTILTNPMRSKTAEDTEPALFLTQLLQNRMQAVAQHITLWKRLATRSLEKES